jgi:hypothetical protein
MSLSSLHRMPQVHMRQGDFRRGEGAVGKEDMLLVGPVVKAKIFIYIDR